MIASTESSNNSMIACHFSVNKKQFEGGEKAQMPKWKAACGHQLVFDALQKRLADWIQELRLSSHIVTCTALRIRMLNLVKMPKIAVKKPADFVTSVVLVEFLNPLT